MSRNRRSKRRQPPTYLVMNGDCVLHRTSDPHEARSYQHQAAVTLPAAVVLTTRVAFPVVSATLREGGGR